MRKHIAILLLFVACAAPGYGQPAPAPPPAATEIAVAYQSKLGETGLGPFRIEPRRIKNVRGWALKFKRLSLSGGPIAVTSRYRVIARSGQSCAEYLVTDMVPMGNPKIKPVLNVEVRGVNVCR